MEMRFSSERSRIYEFEPGDMTKYIIVVTDMNSPTSRSIIGGVTSEFKLVSIFGNYPSRNATYPFDFSHTFKGDGREGYVANKLNIDNHTSKMICNLLECIREENTD